MLSKKINRYARKFQTGFRRIYRTSPFQAEKKLILHCGYHRGGTTWFNNILSSVADYFGLYYQLCEPWERSPNTEIYLCNDSKVDLVSLHRYAGTHMIRDPRDLIVSGYHYHKHTHELWAHKPQKEYDGKSYQEYLNSLSEFDGLMAEIKRTSPTILRMVQWDYDNPNILELTYEKIITNESIWWKKVFSHYGFSENAIETAIKIAEKYSINAVKGKQVSSFMTEKHIKSGDVEQWKIIFKPEHKKHFHELCGDALIRLGYETGREW